MQHPLDVAGDKGRIIRLIIMVRKPILATSLWIILLPACSLFAQVQQQQVEAGRASLI